MKSILSGFLYTITFCHLHANEDHLVLVPRPVIIVQDSAEHIVIDVPYISGYGLDFLAYCDRIAKPQIVDVHSPSSEVNQIDINPLSRSGLVINAEEKAGGSHNVTLDFSAVKNNENHAELLKIATKCVFMFGDRCLSPFKTEFTLKGVDKDSSLHNELKIIQDDRIKRQSHKTK